MFPPDWLSRRAHEIIQDIQAHFTRSHNWILPSLRTYMAISHSKIGLNEINAYLRILNAVDKRESIIVFAFLLLII